MRLEWEDSALFEHAFSYAAIGMAIVDLDGRCILANRSLCDYLGYSESELREYTFREITHPDDLDSDEANVRRLLDGQVPSYQIEKRYIHRSGEIVWAILSVSLARDPEGEPLFFVSQIQDITERKRLERRNRRLRSHRERIEEDLQRVEENYRSLVDEFPEAIILAQGPQWVYVNDAAVRLLGAGSKEELLQRDSYQIVHPDFHDRIRLRWEAVESGRNRLPAMEEKFVRLDGQVIDVEVICIPAVFRKVKLRCLLVRNITELKRTQELILHSEKLAVAGQFAAAVAHEIRNPLTAIKGFLQLLKPDMADKSRFFDVIFTEMTRIEMITNELLILAKPQLTKFTAKDVRFLMQQVVAFMDAQANMSNVLIQVDYCALDLYVLCDENQLKQVFINFIKNAIEAMPNGGMIKIKMSRTEDGRVTIRFVDRGGGIAEDKLGKLGEPFFTTKENGTGLGLMVTKRIVEQHNGDVRFRSKLGEGTTVEMTLPPLPPEERPDPSVTQSASK